MAMHESFTTYTEIKGASDRGFGLTVGGLFLVLALWGFWRYGGAALTWAFVAVGVPLLLLGLISPARLAPLNRAWMRLGLLLSKIVTPVVMGAIFFLVVTPLGVLMRASGRDPLRLKRDAAPSHWRIREPRGPLPETMPEQF
jgi:polyferredoxin